MGALKRFPVGDVTAKGYLSTPETGRGPGVLVLHAWWGLNAFFKQFCDRLAAEGFVVFAPDLYYGSVAETIDDAKRLRAKLNRSFVNTQIVTALEFLRSRRMTASARCGVVGFSLGANYAMWLAANQPRDLAAVVLFYGSGSARLNKSEAAFQAHFAEEDMYVSEAAVQRWKQTLESAGRELEAYTYPGTTHWFFEENQPAAYDARAARQAWRRMVKFLKKHLRERD